MIMYKENDCINAVKRSFENYKSSGARSTEKLKPIHAFFAKTLDKIFEQKCQVHSLGTGLKELTVEGKYYPKNIDITVCQLDKPVFCLGIKFVTSNYKQNANNYFENMMGETANVQAMNELHYAHAIILRYKTPYYTKSGDIKKIETISEKDIRKYLKLAFDSKQAHQPFGIGVLIVDIDESTQEVQKVNTKDIFSKDFANYLNKNYRCNIFLMKLKVIKNFCQLNKKY